MHVSIACPKCKNNAELTLDEFNARNRINETYALFNGYVECAHCHYTISIDIW